VLAVGVVAALVVASPAAASPVASEAGRYSTVPAVVPAGSATPAALPKDIVYSKDATGNAQYDLFVMDETGGQATALTTTSSGQEYQPTWSPDGDRIAFTGWFDAKTDLFVMDANGSNLKNLTRTSDLQEGAPVWSPDGDRIAFTSRSETGRDDIFVMDADGSNRVDLTNTPDESEFNPTWSPDGARIAFDEESFVWVMDADGTDRVQLTTASGFDPAWSPDGTKIAFVSKRDGPGEEIYVMDADGSDQTRLTTSTSRVDFQPSWAPDSARIVFASNYHASAPAYDEYDLYVTNLAGQVTRLTNNTYDELHPSWRVLPQVPVAGLYKSITPVRVVDTRPGSQVGPYATPWGPGETRSVPVIGVGGVTADAEAVVVNVTGVFPSAPTHLTVWPGGTAMPGVSNVNLGPGQVVANLAVVGVGAYGDIAVYNNSGSMHVVIDIVGFHGPRPTGARFHPLNAPVRVLDSRPASQVGPYATPWAGGQTRTLTVAGITVTPTTGSPVDIPAGTAAVALNVTGVFPTQATHLTVWPTGRVMPTASNLNLPAGDVRPNLVIAKVGLGGQISIFNNAGQTHVVADLVGYYQLAPGGLVYTSLTPTRVLDSRPGSQIGPYSTPWGPAATRAVQVGGIGSVPAYPGTVVVNVTGVFPTQATHLTVWPNGQSMPVASNLNLPAGDVRPNLVITREESDWIAIYNNSGALHVIADVAGYFHA
jgi:dipeptidyl aminopeptidase/acylaminoacyl peptidase